MSFNLQNGYASCNGHHKFFCHGDPEGFREVVIEWLKPIDYISMKAYASTYQRHFKLEDYTLVEKYLVAIRDMVQNGEYLTRDVVSHMIREDHIRNALLVPGPTDGLSPEERAAIQKTAIQYAGKGGNDAEEVE